MANSGLLPRDHARDTHRRYVPGKLNQLSYYECCVEARSGMKDHGLVIELVTVCAELEFGPLGIQEEETNPNCG